MKVKKTTTPRLYKNTIKVGKTKSGALKISGRGTKIDYAEAMKLNGPPAHAQVNVLHDAGLAAILTTVHAPRPERGRTSAVYEFAVNKGVR
jgi:hypothetical protein|tara:strand:+ start:1380 stop:1652 length:273 start_codon:yes stop_codon:yes gene_type:complete